MSDKRSNDVIMREAMAVLHQWAIKEVECELCGTCFGLLKHRLRRAWSVLRGTDYPRCEMSLSIFEKLWALTMEYEVRFKF